MLDKLFGICDRLRQNLNCMFILQIFPKRLSLTRFTGSVKIFDTLRIGA